MRGEKASNQKGGTSKIMQQNSMIRVSRIKDRDEEEKNRKKSSREKRTILKREAIIKTDERSNSVAAATPKDL